jgi:hypothetical protein
MDPSTQPPHPRTKNLRENFGTHFPKSMIDTTYASSDPLKTACTLASSFVQPNLRIPSSIVKVVIISGRAPVLLVFQLRLYSLVDGNPNGVETRIVVYPYGGLSTSDTRRVISNNSQFSEHQEQSGYARAPHAH